MIYQTVSFAMVTEETSVYYAYPMAGNFEVRGEWA